jgi:hypothetical protein
MEIAATRVGLLPPKVPLPLFAVVINLRGKEGRK